MEEKISTILDLLWHDIINATIIGSKALLILVIGIWFAYFVSKKARKILQKALKDEMLSGFLSKVIFVAVVILVVVAVLGTMGVQTTSIIAALGAAGLAIALALKDSLSNLASGIMLVVFRPFTKNDTIEVENSVGIVEDISLFHTYMKTPDGKLVVIPNTNIANSQVINYTAKKAGSKKMQDILDSAEVVRRIDWLIGVSYDSDIDKTKEIIRNAVLSTQNINDGKNDPQKAAFVGLNELQASAIEFAVRAWVINNDEFFKTKCDMIENVKKALDAANIEIPYNKLDVKILK
ncbi:mechanosensitive ion channel family protein [Helicobacter sp. MIT 99-5507]|uniref:mechanosensitive ion channel family protein n=1 Tax=Helicobacter sp. MIT 99-5507 TaxID=152489 RepID=UPI000E1F1825|nr:mechanosensitive ion channel domain-containing protein [Helicobacter sp. MIT 99-5507]RDU57457.1 mechanosensitive ion channel protein MscS [Helicobacter sp. MIT 99-5507]